MTPKQIIERHSKFPEATKTLIEAYGFQQYRKAVEDLINKFGKVTNIPDSFLTIIVCNDLNFNDWKSGMLSDYKMNNK
jgi:hypothetical protein